MRSFRTLCRIALLLLIAPLSFSAQAQTFWGAAQEGGTYANGTIYTMNDAGTYTKKHDFFKFYGGTPKSDLLKATNGLYYGVTEAEGEFGGGVLFSYNTLTEAYTVLYHFPISTVSTSVGYQPVRGLVQASNGLIYGMCYKGGGTTDKGSLWSYDIATNTLTRLVAFSGTNGANPYSKLIIGNTATTLWGTTQRGGTNDWGTIFQYTIGGSLAVRFSFGTPIGNTTGYGPRCQLTRTTGGRLFGVAYLGGTNALGTVFEIGASSPFTYTVVRTLAAADGGGPVGGLVEGATNVLYGTTTTNGAGGSGTIFRVDATAATATFTKLLDLNGTVVSNIYSTMTKGTDGLLYGTSTTGGASSAGVIFSYNISTNVLTSLSAFQPTGLSETWGSLIQDGTVWYGMSAEGGGGSGGGLYRFTPATSTITPLIYFASSNGKSPKGRLLMASNGKLYGLTLNGGAAGQGVLYSIDATTAAFTRVVDLGGTNGTFPQGWLVEVSGKLYGMCSNGGANAAGTIFELDLNTNVFTKKKDLELINGSEPTGGFLVASNGSFYTTMSKGGADGSGTLVRYVPSTNTLTKLHDFSATTGSRPQGGLIQAANGLVYGTALRGGVSDAGTLFSFNTTSNTFTKLFDFDFLQGGAPAGDLMQATNGKLYGMCGEEGLFFNGAIYSWNTTTNTYTEEYDMSNAEGRFSESNLVQATDGKLYGSCVQGGTNDEGTVFRFDPTTLVYTKLHDFALATTGKWPLDGLTKQVLPAPSTDLLLDAKLFLEGPFVTADAMMTDGLRTLSGANGFPLTEPFTALGFTQAGGGGGETIAASVLTATGPNAIVDWVLVELRDKNNSASIVRTRAALLQRDGNIVGLNGTSVLTIPAAAGEYFVAIRPRNHHGVMRSTVVALNSSTATTLDFTNGTVTTFGTNAQKTVGAFRVCWAGDVRRDKLLKYTGANNDRDPILVRIGGTVPTNTVNGYFMEDVNMNGQVKYTGGSNDRDPILVNIGGTVPTATRTEQIP